MIKEENNVEEENNTELEISLESVKYVETKYKELRDRKGDCANLRDTIESYHHWFNLSITLFSRYFMMIQILIIKNLNQLIIVGMDTP